MNIYLLVFMLTLPAAVFSQTDSNTVYQPMAGRDKNGIKLEATDVLPRFKGGMPAFAAYLRQNLVYPQQAISNGIQGKVVLAFVVEKDGSLSDIKVLRGLGYGCDEAAVNVLSHSPRWLPGVQKGRPVRVQYTLPISFGTSR